MKIIGATGKAGSGKDTLLKGVALEMEFTHVFEIHGFADPIKDALEAIFGWRLEFWDDRDWREREMPELGRSPRYMAQTLGTEWGRKINPDIWLIIMKHRAKMFEDAPHVSPKVLMLPDVRFENEAAWIRESGGVLIEVVRGSPDDIEEADHISEAGVPDRYVTHSIINDGTIDELIVKGIMSCGF